MIEIKIWRCWLLRKCLSLLLDDDGSFEFVLQENTSECGHGLSLQSSLGIILLLQFTQKSIIDFFWFVWLLRILLISSDLILRSVVLENFDQFPSASCLPVFTPALLESYRVILCMTPNQATPQLCFQWTPRYIPLMNGFHIYQNGFSPCLLIASTYIWYLLEVLPCVK